MTGTDSTDFGLQAIRHFHEIARIDEEWCRWNGRSFTWWAYHLPQRVWAEPARVAEGKVVYKIGAATDLVRGVSHTDVAKLLGPMGTVASLSGLVYDPAERTIRYTAMAYLHDENLEEARRLFCFAAALQCVEAQARAEPLARILNGETCESGPPGAGLRGEPDDMLNIVRDMIRPGSASPDAVLGEELEEFRDFCISRGFVSNGDRKGVTVEFPWGPDGSSVATGGESALLMIDTTDAHPALGEGVLFRLFLPCPHQGGALATEFNRREREDFTMTQGLGSWCLGSLPYGPDLSTCYVSFLPTAILLPSSVTNHALGMFGRTKWAYGVTTGHQQGASHEWH